MDNDHGRFGRPPGKPGKPDKGVPPGRFQRSVGPKPTAPRPSAPPVKKGAVGKVIVPKPPKV
jgi:hypothetical protein